MRNANSTKSQWTICVRWQFFRFNNFPFPGRIFALWLSLSLSFSFSLSLCIYCPDFLLANCCAVHYFPIISIDTVNEREIDTACVGERKRRRLRGRAETAKIRSGNDKMRRFIEIAILPIIQLSVYHGFNNPFILYSLCLYSTNDVCEPVCVCVCMRGIFYHMRETHCWIDSYVHIKLAEAIHNNNSKNGWQPMLLTHTIHVH